MKEFINEFKIAHWGIKVLFIEFIILIICLIGLAILLFLDISNASCIMPISKRHEYRIYEKCINDSCIKDIGKKDFYYLYHDYSTSDGEYKIILNTDSECMDCWYCYIEHGPRILYSSEHLHICKQNFSSNLLENLAQKIIKDFNLRWENTHGDDSKENKCLYHTIFK